VGVGGYTANSNSAVSPQAGNLFPDAVFFIFTFGPEMQIIQIATSGVNAHKQFFFFPITIFPKRYKMLLISRPKTTYNFS